MAISEIEKLEARWAENPDGRYFAPLADAYRKAGQVDRALELLASGLAKHPDYLSAHIVLGRCQLDRKDDVAARLAFESVLGLDGENIIALKCLAEITEREGDTVGARRWLERLIAVDSMNEEAAQDLERLGGPVGDGEVPAAAAQEVSGAEISFSDVLGTDVPAAEAAPTEPVPALPEPALPEPAPASIEAIAAADTVPIPAIEALEPTAAEPPVLQEPPARLHEYQSAAFEAPAEPVAPAPELEPMAFEPPAEQPEAAAPVEGFTDFDDQLSWGVGERMSHAIRAEDIAAAESAHEQTAVPIEFVEPITEVSFAEDAPAPSAGGLELPARSTGAIEIDLSAVDAAGPSGAGTAAEPDAVAGPAEEPVEWITPEAPAGAAEPALPEEAAPEVAATEAEPVVADLPLIMPEEVTPPEEMARPSGRRARVSGGVPGAESSPPAEPLLTETMAELYLRQGFKDQAADVYRRLLAQRPDDTGLQAKLAALEAPPTLSASGMGTESVGAFLRRIARASLHAPASPEAPAAEPSTMEEVFAEPLPAPAPAEAPGPAPAAPLPGADARPATDAFTLDQVFGGSAPAPAAAPTPPPPPASLGASFDEFFGAAPSAQDSVRPRESEAARPSSEEDLGAFTAWLHGLKR